MAHYTEVIYRPHISLPNLDIGKRVSRVSDLLRGTSSPSKEGLYLCVRTKSVAWIDEWPGGEEK